MRVAWDVAARTDPDCYLWLNDDTHLFLDALARFWGWHQRMGLQDRIGILVGSTCDPENGRFTYGGRRRISRLNAIATAQVPPSDTPVPCDTFNGNCLWLPRQAANRTGRLGEEFQHGMADYDYGFRAKNQGVPSWVLPGFIGDCTLNPKGKPWERPGLTLKARWEFITDPRGLPPLSWIRFSLRHGGWTGPLLAIKPYLSLILYHILNKPNE
jgi:GT2 family glycosyltransferase